MQIVVPPSLWRIALQAERLDALVEHAPLCSPGAGAARARHQEQEEAKKRTIVLHSAMNLSVKTGCSSSSSRAGTLVFRAADDGEARVWLDKLRGLLDTLKSEGRVAVARAQLPALHSRPHFLELPRWLAQPAPAARGSFSVRRLRPGGASPTRQPARRRCCST